MKKLIFPFLLTFLLLQCSQPANVPIHHVVLVPASPESVGMSSDRLSRIDNLMEEYMQHDWIPGAVTLIARHGKIVHHKSYGQRDMEASDPLEKDDIFRIASMTKAITSMAVMMLYEEGKFLLSDPVSKYIPEFATPEVLVKANPDSTYESRPAKREITIRHLLTHTSGISYAIFDPRIRTIYYKAGLVDAWSLEPDLLADKMKVLARMPLVFDPGDGYNYGLSIDVLGYLVEIISGKSLNEFMKERLFDPLGMEDTHFYLPEEKYDRLVKLYSEDESGLSPNEDHLFDFPVDGAGTYFSGGGGLCATTLDYARFMQMMLNGGHYNGHQLLSPKTVALVRMNQTGEYLETNGFGLGFGITDEKGAARELSSEGNYGWGGYFHTHFWIDPMEDLIGLLMLQVLPNIHPEIETKFQVLTYQSIIELNKPGSGNDLDKRVIESLNYE